MNTLTQQIQRQFILEHNGNTITLDDPNPNLPIQTIQNIYANQYPELFNASIVEKGLVDFKMTYEFQTIAGTKG